MEINGAPRLMIVSDLDNTMVDHQDHDNKSLLRFGALWQAEYNHDSLLVFSTGRSPALYAKLRADVPLLTPGITIMSVGTEIRYGNTMAPDHGWEKELSVGWDREAIVEEAGKLNLKFQVESEQRPHKVSFYVDKKEAQHVLATLTDRFKARGVNAKLIYSGGVDLDVLPEGAGKGQALAYLMRKFKAEGRSPGHTLVCGDSGNDAELFTVADVYGVIVGNAMEELLQWHSQHTGDKSHIFLATERCASGILQAMQHFDLQPNVSPRDHPLALVGNKRGHHKVDAVAAAHEVVEYLLLMEQWLKGDVDSTDEVFNRLKLSLVCFRPYRFPLSQITLSAPAGEVSGTNGSLSLPCMMGVMVSYSMSNRHKTPDSSLIHAHGIISNPYEEIETFRKLHGVRKGKHLAIWVDRVRIEKLSEHFILARFDKWEKTDHQTTCVITTAHLQVNADLPNGLQWKLIHETWLASHEGHAPRTHEAQST